MRSMKTTLLAVLALTGALVSPFSAAHAAQTAQTRVFELRTYHAAPGRFDALHARFRGHANALFAKHHITVVGYWVPMDEDKGHADTLVYMLAHESRAAAEASWK